MPHSYCPLLLAISLAACGGIATVSASDSDGGTAAPGPIAPPGTPSPPSSPSPPSPPTQTADEPVGPSSEAIATTDVSILYPLPATATIDDFVKPTSAGAQGVLFSKATFDALAGGVTRLEPSAAQPSGYDSLRLISLRLDPCSVRNTTIPGDCRSEVRLVLQALYTKMAGADGDPSSGPAATDGALHVVYDVPAPELDVMMNEILTLKRSNGNLGRVELAPHPILVAQGLKGTFAQGLRSTVLAHLGDARVARVTFFDHQDQGEGHTWAFGAFDRDTSAPGATFTATAIPNVGAIGEVVGGSSAFSTSVATSSANIQATIRPKDDLAELISGYRTTPPANASTLQAQLVTALELENPKLRNVQNADCASCHLAEGAHRVGAEVFGLSTASRFVHSRSLARVDQRTSMTNLHAFGYLRRQVSIMQRTANESVLVAESFTARRAK